jgi:glucose/arabinose dehydrogenase
MRHVASLVAILFLAAACTSAMQDLSTPPAETTAAATAAATEAVPTATAAPSPAADAADEDAPDAALLPTPTPDAATGAQAAPPAPPDLSAVAVRLEPVLEDLDGPLFVTHAGDGSGRLFVLEKIGRIRVVQDGQLLETPFLDITGRVSLASEQGLLGLAFAPDYAQSGEFFINYTDLNGDTVISRWVVSADSNVADAGSERVLLQLDQPAPNHNGGMLAFGPDGYLWIGMGDGGAANDRFGNGQNPETLLGKMLRIDVLSDGEDPYVIPADNPWVTADWNGQDVRDEIWAIGLRNPWRYSFDRQTGDLWIADVGQNLIEEINVVPAGTAGGLNFGWPIMEGKSCFGAETCDQTGLMLPVTDYRHEGNCSVTGGYVYRGQAHPTWNGVYFYGDYCSGRLWALAPDGSGGWNTVELARNPVTISSFGEDEAGELYLTDLAGGEVYRLTE